MAIGLFTPLRLAPLLALSLSPEAAEAAALRGEGAMVAAAVVPERVVATHQGGVWRVGVVACPVMMVGKRTGGRG